MNTGAVATFVAFGASGAALIAYLIAWSGNRGAFRLARTAFAIMTAALFLASVLLMAAILSNDFSFVYVTNYSSFSTPLLYKISAFWAGQDGTVLLWTLFQALIGLFIMKRRDEWEAPVLSFLLVAQGLLLLVLLKMQPFRTAPPPADGFGLNPLLRDPWMAIHPPIVFVGYAALAAPFAFALAALAMKRTDTWANRVLPWVLVSVVTLGAGLFLGGFWAYKVLGWGGYWGWDPVENSSLAPWIAVTALVHGLLTQRQRGSLARTNFILATLSYVLALYSTYLTRSGVLSNFSVHSFADGGINTYLVLLLLVTTLLSAGFIVARWRGQRSPALDWSLSLPSMMAFAIIFLMMATALLVIGTSWPIISTLAGSPSNPGPGFYNRVSLPIGIAMIALLAAAPLMTWIRSAPGSLARVIVPGFSIGLAAAALPLLMGLTPKGGPLMLLLLAAAVAALVASLIRLGRQVRINPMAAGAAIAHAGVALMFIGIVSTSAFDSMESAVLTMGGTTEVQGHQMTLKAYHAADHGMEPHFEIEATGPNGRRFTATPIMFSYGPDRKMMARPYIERSILEDLYISPVSYRPGEPPTKQFTLVRQEKLELEDVSMTFLRFQSHAPEGGGMRVGAVVEIERGEEKGEMILEMAVGQSGPVSEWTEVPLVSGVSAKLDGMQVESGAIRVTFRLPPEAAVAATLAVDVSRKPLINVLWLGLLLVSAGSALAAWQRKQEEDLRAAMPAPDSGKQTARPVPVGMVPVARRAARR